MTTDTPSVIRFGKAGGRLFNLDDISVADFSEIEALRAKVTLRSGLALDVDGIEALELAMQLRPAVLESRRLRWPKHAWAVHNLIGHPLMQLLAWCRAYRWAFKVHDATVPRPTGPR